MRRAGWASQVRALGEDVDAVHAETEGLAVSVLVADKLQRAEADFPFDGLPIGFDGEGVESLRAEAVRPPELRVADGELGRGTEGAAVARHGGADGSGLAVEGEDDVERVAGAGGVHGAQLRRKGDADRAARMALLVPGVVERGGFGAKEDDIAVDAGDGKRNPPVPAA